MMKKLFLLILAVNTAHLSYAQSPLENASKLYFKGDYKAALALYKKIEMEKPSAYVYEKKGDCYLKMASVPQAKEEYLIALAANNKSIEPSAITTYSCGLNLASIYFKENNFRKALNYYQLAADAYPKIHLDDFAINFPAYNTLNEVHCYVALNKTDSAIIKITPYLFYRNKGLIDTKADSLQRENNSRFCLEILQKKYTNTQIKAAFKKADDNFSFTERIEPETSYGYTFHFFTASTEIYGQRITLFGRGIGIAKDQVHDFKLDQDLSKEYQLVRFRNYPLNRLVRKLPD